MTSSLPSSWWGSWRKPGRTTSSLSGAATAAKRSRVEDRGTMGSASPWTTRNGTVSSAARPQAGAARPVHFDDRPGRCPPVPHQRVMDKALYDLRVPAEPFWKHTGHSRARRYGGQSAHRPDLPERTAGQVHSRRRQDKAAQLARPGNSVSRRQRAPQAVTEHHDAGASPVDQLVQVGQGPLEAFDIGPRPSERPWPRRSIAHVTAPLVAKALPTWS